jgi:drug/metabolite transporter (DMT)-like permease
VRNAPLGVALAAGSGLLYGAINVAAKFVPGEPFAQAGVAYVASFLLLSPFLRGLRIARHDWPLVLAMGLLGGGLAPVLLFYGLREAGAADTGLLLTMEMVATAAFAVSFLRERIPGRDGLGLLCLLLASCAVALAAGRDGATTARGALLILGAAVAWGVDNTVSARLVGAYKPPALIAVKGLLGCGASFVALALTGGHLPPPSSVGALVLMGVVSVGASSILFYNALGHVGAARTSAMNIATTALVGALGGSLLLHERLGWLHAVALALVAAGALLLGLRPSAASVAPTPPKPS